MRDGRIDHQGTVADLRAQGVLDDIAHGAEAEPNAETMLTSPKVEGEDRNKAHTPRKLVEDEHREIGGVKWSIYKSYLKSSYDYLSLIIPRLISSIGHTGFGGFWHFSL